MTARYYDTSSAEDAVRLLSYPLNCDNGNPDDCDHAEDNIKTHGSAANPDQACQNVSSGDTNNVCLTGNDYHHCHQFTPNYSNNNSRLRLILVMCLCLIFMGAEIIGGCIAGSLAVVTDGAHLVTDLIGFLISFIAISSSKRKSSKRFNFGFYRIEILSTLISILLLWIMTGIFIYLAAMRLYNNDYEIEVDLMILVSCLGVVINIVMFLVLHGGCHTKHAHSHFSGLEGNESNNQNINVRAAIIHVLGDLVQSVGVFISSIIIKFYPNAKFMDPVCTFLFSIIVICSTLKLLKDSVYIVMEAFPINMNYNKVLLSLQELNGVRHVHSLCVWSLTVDTNVLTVHLAVDENTDREKLLTQARKLITKKFNISHHTIQIEKFQSISANGGGDFHKSSWN